MSHACRAHSTYAREAKAGGGIDRHLLALRNLAGVCWMMEKGAA